MVPTGDQPSRKVNGKIRGYIVAKYSKFDARNKKKRNDKYRSEKSSVFKSAPYDRAKMNKMSRRMQASE